MKTIYKIDLNLHKAWVGEDEAHDCQPEWSFWGFSDLGAAPFDFVSWILSIGSAWTSIGKDVGTCSEVLYFELTGERYVMTFLNVLNFGDQGKCDGTVEWWQSFLSHCSSHASENDLKYLKIAWKSENTSKPLWPFRYISENDWYR